jgi:outer membrane protein assembly factor BamB
MFFISIRAILNKLILSAFLCNAAAFPLYSQKVDATPEAVPLKKCWTSQLGSAEARSLFSDGSALYAAMSDGRLHALSAEDGSSGWTVEIGGSFVSNIIAANDDLVVISNSSGDKKQSTIRSISKQTGIVHWRAEVPFSEKYFLGGARQNEIAAVGSTGVVLGVSLENGSTIWKVDTGEVSAEPSFLNGLVVVGTSSKRVVVITQPERKISLNLESKWKPTAVALLAGGNLIVGDERGNIVEYDSAGNTDWKFKNGASISHLMQTEAGILVASNDNFLYMLTDSRGGVVWKRRLSGRIALEPVVGKDSIFAVTYGDGRGYLLSLHKGKIIDQTADSNKDFTPLTIAGLTEGRIAVPTTNGVALFAASGCSTRLAENR